MSFQIVTDTGCDFSAEQYRALGLTAVPMNITFRGAPLQDYSDQTLKELYAAFRKGETPATTAAANPAQWESAITPILSRGEDVLVLTFSSALSTTYSCAVIAAENLKEQFPDRQILVVDSLCASMGQGLLVYYVCRKRDSGATLARCADYAEEIKGSLCHWFTVEDLLFLKRSGRLSSAAAYLGAMLHIQPVLHMDDAGHLVSVSKVRGRRSAIQALAEKLAQTGLPGENETVFLCHGDCPEDARLLADLLKEKYGVKEVVTRCIGAAIGVHSGPGTLAIFYLGKER